MNELTPRQREILGFIQQSQQNQGVTPSLRDIGRHFGFRSMSSVVDHVRALRRKGALTHQPRRARSLQVAERFVPRPRPRKWVEIPVYGSIPAGHARDREQESAGCLTVEVESLGIKPTARTFAVQVQGDSMIGKHIVEGDYVILEHGVTPRHGDVVAALIDNESTLKTFVLEKKKPYLRAENPSYPKLTPADELVIQGVMVALIRKRK